jgi:hypothetical protein
MPHRKGCSRPSGEIATFRQHPYRSPPVCLALVQFSKLPRGPATQSAHAIRMILHASAQPVPYYAMSCARDKLVCDSACCAEGATPPLRTFCIPSTSLQVACLKRSRFATIVIPTSCDCGIAFDWCGSRLSSSRSHCTTRAKASSVLPRSGRCSSMPLIRASRRSFRARTLALRVILGLFFLEFPFGGRGRGDGLRLRASGRYLRHSARSTFNAPSKTSSTLSAPWRKPVLRIFVAQTCWCETYHAGFATQDNGTQMAFSPSRMPST